MLLTWIDPSGLGHHFDCIGIGGVHFPFAHCHGAQCRSHGAQFPEAGGGHVHVFGVKDYIVMRIWQLDTEGPRKYFFRSLYDGFGWFWYVLVILNFMLELW